MRGDTGQAEWITTRGTRWRGSATRRSRRRLFRLRAARMAIGVDPKTMAATLGMPSSSYASYETAKAYPTIEVIAAFPARA